MLPSEIRRLVEEQPVVKIDRKELDRQVAEYLASGGCIEVIPMGKSAVDFSNKIPGVYGKHAF